MSGSDMVPTIFGKLFDFSVTIYEWVFQLVSLKNNGLCKNKIENLIVTVITAVRGITYPFLFETIISRA